MNFQTAKLVLDGYFSSDLEQLNPGVDYFSFEEETAFAPATESLISTPLTPKTPSTPLTPSNVLGRETSLESSATTESEETFKPLGSSASENIPKKGELNFVQEKCMVDFFKNNLQTKMWPEFLIYSFFSN